VAYIAGISIAAGFLENHAGDHAVYSNLAVLYLALQQLIQDMQKKITAVSVLV